MYNKRLASKIVADTIRYKLLFYVQSKADMTLLNLPHGTNNKKVENRETVRNQKLFNFPPHLTREALPGNTREPEIVSFHVIFCDVIYAVTVTGDEWRK